MILRVRHAAAASQLIAIEHARPGSHKMRHLYRDHSRKTRTFLTPKNALKNKGYTRVHSMQKITAIFITKIRVRSVHKCALYLGDYGSCDAALPLCFLPCPCLCNLCEARPTGSLWRVNLIWIFNDDFAPFFHQTTQINFQHLLFYLKCRRDM